jgi:membrane-associated phospholipid phosphatase
MRGEEGKTKMRRRIFIALGVSGVVNVTWLVLDGLIAHAQQPDPKVMWIVDKLGTPGGAIANSLAPSGHTVGTALAFVLIAVLSSILFYASVVWIILSIPAWWREVRHSAASNFWQ